MSNDRDTTAEDRLQTSLLAMDVPPPSADLVERVSHRANGIQRRRSFALAGGATLAVAGLVASVAAGQALTDNPRSVTPAAAPVASASAVPSPSADATGQAKKDKEKTSGSGFKELPVAFLPPTMLPHGDQLGELQYSTGIRKPGGSAKLISVSDEVPNDGTTVAGTSRWDGKPVGLNRGISDNVRDFNGSGSRLDGAGFSILRFDNAQQSLTVFNQTIAGTHPQSLGTKLATKSWPTPAPNGTRFLGVFREGSFTTYVAIASVDGYLVSAAQFADGVGDTWAKNVVVNGVDAMITNLRADGRVK